MEASWRRKMIDPIGQVWTPFGSVRGDVYSYQDAVNPDVNNPVPRHSGRYRLRGQAVGGLLYSYPFVAHTANASHVIEPTATDHRAPEQDRPAAPAGRGCQEPRVRRHAAVRCRQVLGLRPLRDGHACQLRHAVHLPGQQWRVCARRVRPELSPGRRECLHQSGLRSGQHAGEPNAQLLAGQRPRDQSVRLRCRPLPVADPRPQPDLRRAASTSSDWSLRRQDTLLRGTLRPDLRPRSATRSRSSIPPPACSTSSRTAGWHRFAPDRQLERRRHDALRHRCQGAHPGPDPAQVLRRVLRADGELYRDVRRERRPSS